MLSHILTPLSLPGVLGVDCQLLPAMQLFTRAGEVILPECQLLALVMEEIIDFLIRFKLRDAGEIEIVLVFEGLCHYMT